MIVQRHTGFRHFRPEDVSHHRHAAAATSAALVHILTSPIVVKFLSQIALQMSPLVTLLQEADLGVIAHGVHAAECSR